MTIEEAGLKTLSKKYPEYEWKIGRLIEVAELSKSWEAPDEDYFDIKPFEHPPGGEYSIRNHQLGYLRCRKKLFTLERLRNGGIFISALAGIAKLIETLL